MNNKGADQPALPCSLISTFVVRYLDSIIPILAKSKISRLASLCSWAGQFESHLVTNPKETGFLVTRLISLLLSLLYRASWLWLVIVPLHGIFIELFHCVYHINPTVSILLFMLAVKFFPQIIKATVCKCLHSSDQVQVPKKCWWPWPLISTFPWHIWSESPAWP